MVFIPKRLPEWSDADWIEKMIDCQPRGLPERSNYEGDDDLYLSDVGIALQTRTHRLNIMLFIVITGVLVVLSWIWLNG